MSYWLLFTFLMYVATTITYSEPRVLHKRQRKLIDVIDRRVMIFLTTYFRTTLMADVQEALLSQRGRAMLCVCIASIH